MSINIDVNIPIFCSFLSIRTILSTKPICKPICRERLEPCLLRRVGNVGRGVSGDSSSTHRKAAGSTRQSLKREVWWGQADMVRRVQVACVAVVSLLALDNASGFSMAPNTVPRRAASALGAPAMQRRPTASHHPGVLGMVASSTVGEMEKRPITKLRLVQHKAEAFWFYR